MIDTSFDILRQVPRCTMLLLMLAAGGCGRSDSAVQADVETGLALDAETAPFALGVEVDDGVVSLSGNMLTMEQQARALEVARSINGVKEVRSSITIFGKVLVAAVQQALAADPVLATVPIKVDFRDGRVRLMSDQTDRAQRERAVAVARSVEGVKDVEDRMK